MKYALRSLALVALAFCWSIPAYAGIRLPVGSPVTIGQTVKLNASGQVIPTTAITDQVVGVARTGSAVTGTKIDLYTAGESAACDCLAGAIAGDWLALSTTAGSGDAGSTTQPKDASLIGIVSTDRDGSGECVTTLWTAPPIIVGLGATRGDILSRGAATWDQLALGEEGHRLRAGANDPAYLLMETEDHRQYVYNVFGIVPHTIYYVNGETGDDTDTGLTEALAFSSWQRGVDVAGADEGSAVLIMQTVADYTTTDAGQTSGDTTRSIEVDQGVGSKVQPLMILAYPGHRPVLDASDLDLGTEDTTIRVDDRDDVYFAGLTINNIEMDEDTPDSLNMGGGIVFEGSKRSKVYYCSFDGLTETSATIADNAAFVVFLNADAATFTDGADEGECIGSYFANAAIVGANENVVATFVGYSDDWFFAHNYYTGNDGGLNVKWSEDAQTAQHGIFFRNIVTDPQFASDQSPRGINLGSFNDGANGNFAYIVGNLFDGPTSQQGSEEFIAIEYNSGTGDNTTNFARVWGNTIINGKIWVKWDETNDPNLHHMFMDRNIVFFEWDPNTLGTGTGSGLSEFATVTPTTGTALPSGSDEMQMTNSYFFATVAVTNALSVGRDDDISNRNFTDDDAGETAFHAQYSGSSGNQFNVDPFTVEAYPWIADVGINAGWTFDVWTEPSMGSIVNEEATNGEVPIWDVAFLRTRLMTAAEAGLMAAQTLTDNAVVRADGIAGQVQNSGVIIDDSDNITGHTQNADTITTGTLVEARGGTGQATMEAAIEATPVDTFTLKEQASGPGAAAANTLDLWLTDDPNPRLQGSDDNNDEHGWVRTFIRASSNQILIFDAAMPDSAFSVIINTVVAATGVITWTDASDTADEQAFADALGTQNFGEAWLRNTTRGEDVLVDTGTWNGAGRTLTVDSEFRTAGDGTIDDWAATDVITTKLDLGNSSGDNFSISVAEDVVSEGAEGATYILTRIRVIDTSVPGSNGVWDIPANVQTISVNSDVASQQEEDFMPIRLTPSTDTHPYTFATSFNASGSQTGQYGLFAASYFVE